MTRRSFSALLAGAASVGIASSLPGCVSRDGESPAGVASEDMGDMAVSDIAESARDPRMLQEARARACVARLTIEQKVAQLFIVHPETIAGDALVVAVEDGLREAYGNHPVGGFIFLEPNLVDADQTAQMLSSVAQMGRDAIGCLPFISVDEEGGTVSRVGGNPGFDVPNVGDMCEVGASGDAAYAGDVARTIANYLMPLGFNVDFAPCCDVANNPESDTMMYRSFGSDPHAVAALVRAQVEGFAEAGILCCAKHFPGIGAAVGDSHDETIYSEKTADEIGACELVPFVAAIEAGAPFVMVGHLSLPNITGDDAPASVSRAIVQDLLRDRLGYGGLIITDSLGMGAVSAYGAQAAVMALEAGCDIALMPADFFGSYQAVLDAVEKGDLTEARIDESLLRIMRVKLALEEMAG